LRIVQRNSNHKTQRANILGKLIEAKVGRVSLLEILACAAQYDSRIHELRKMGFSIVNEREHIDGQLHTWFRLVSGPTLQKSQQKSETPGGEATLFPIEPPDRSYLE
jgi:hypothetical protein